MIPTAELEPSLVARVAADRCAETLPFVGIDGACDRCGETLTGRQKRWCSRACHSAYLADHYWTVARPAAKRRDCNTCVRCGRADERLEVNHIEPREGAGYGFGCWHHQSNLETLCHACHVQVTAAQARGCRGTAVRILGLPCEVLL